MSKRNRTIWTEGMFLGPQHFQQHDRFLLHTISATHRAQGAYQFGLLSFELDTTALTEGKIALTQLSGIFPDGTPFRLPEDDDLPDPLNIDSSMRDGIIALAIPFSAQSDKDVTEKKSAQSFSRYLMQDQSVRDRHSPDADAEETVFTAGLWTRLVIESGENTAYHTIPLLRVAERREDDSVRLDNQFYPCALELAASAPLLTLCNEIHGLLSQRARELAGRLGSPNASDTAQLTQFLLLQTVNRYEPLFRHHSAAGTTHPEALYRDMIQLAGELATITNTERVCPRFQDYLHRDQYTTFQSVYLALRESLNWIPDSKVEAIPVKHVKGGIYTATVHDRHLFDSSRFILAVKANVTPDELQRKFPRNSTISSKHKLRDLVEAQSRGIELKTLVTVPNSIPMYENNVYFEMRRDSSLWQEIAKSGDIAMHIAGTYADLSMQVWTVQQ